MCILALTACLAGSPLSLAQSVFDDVEECDLLAANPTDTQRVADGVADGSLIPRLAVKACEAAVAKAPTESRFAYQFGRALAAANRASDAMRQFVRAGDAGYAPALAAQADLQLELWQLAPRPTSRNEALRAAQTALRNAVALHERAVKAGHLPSQDRVRALTFDPDQFGDPILGLINAGQVDAALASVRALERVYLADFISGVLGQCGPLLTARDVARLAVFRTKVSPEQEEQADAGVQSSVAEVDAQRFVRRYGCDGVVTDIFFEIALPAFLVSSQ